MRIKKIIPYKAWLKLRKLKAAIGRALFRILWVFPIDRTKIVFSNFNGKGYGDNPKYVAEEFLKRRRYNLYWLLNDPNQKLPNGIRPIKNNTLNAFYHIATAGIWIDNNRKEPYVVKRKEQYYLQTWHGSIALKKIEKDVDGSIDQFYQENAIRDSGMIDLMVSDSTFSDRLYGESFWYNGEVKRLGTPRFDALFDKSDIDKIRKTLGIGENEYLVLYAPTFRNNGDFSVYDIDLDAVKKAFESKTGRSVHILVRMHPHIPVGTVCFDANTAQDVTAYPDIYDLLKVSDVLITDYSSSIFEFSIAEPKPVFAYAKDRDEYDRGFYFDLDSLPYMFARSNKELIEEIMSFDQEQYEQRLNSFYKSIELFADGKASEHVVDYVIIKTEKSDAVSR